MAGSQARPVIEVRRLTELRDIQEAVALQKQIWGFEDIELLPVRLFVVATKVGGQVMGAFDGPRMVAFLIAIPGIKPDGRQYFHSHMLGVLPEYRDRGIGRLMKLEQRKEALSRGVELIEWTFDPLELKNAFFNLERLGAIVRRFHPNQYGTTSSHLHGGLPTDRLVAEWHLRSERARAGADGIPLQKPIPVTEVEIPASIAEIRSSAPDRAREIQQRAGAAFQAAFTQGLAVTGFEWRGEAGVYLIGPCPSA